MVRMSAPDRYTLRLMRQARELRARTIAAADEGARRARLRARYGPGWQQLLGDAWQRGLVQWGRIVDERNTPGLNPGWDGLVDYLDKG